MSHNPPEAYTDVSFHLWNHVTGDCNRCGKKPLEADLGVCRGILGNVGAMPADFWPERLYLRAQQWEGVPDSEILSIESPLWGKSADVMAANLDAVRRSVWQALEDRRIYPEKYKPLEIVGWPGHTFDPSMERCTRCGATRKFMDDDLAPRECTGNDGWHEELLYTTLHERNRLDEENKLLRTMVDAATMWSHPRVRVRPEDIADKPVSGTKGDIFIVDDPHKSDDDSPEKRAATLKWFEEMVPDRLNVSSPDGPVVVILSRVHEEDNAVQLSPGEAAELVKNLPTTFTMSTLTRTRVGPATKVEGWVGTHAIDSATAQDDAYVLIGIEKGVDKPALRKRIDAVTERVRKTNAGAALARALSRTWGK